MKSEKSIMPSNSIDATVQKKSRRSLRSPIAMHRTGIGLSIVNAACWLSNTLNLTQL